DNDNILIGNAGDDNLTGGNGADTLDGGAGNNTLDGGGGINTADYSASPGGVVVNLLAGTAQNGYGGTETLSNIQAVKGSTHGGTFTGGPGVNMFIIEGGNNTIAGGTASALVSEFSVPTSASNPFTVTTGPDGNVWFTEVAGNKIGHITID